MKAVMTIPAHVGFIMDGNRRYAKRKGLPTVIGHRYGAENLMKVLEWSQKAGIKKVTLYTFSIENFKRPKEELEYLWKLVVEFFKKFLDKLKKAKGRVKKAFGKDAAFMNVNFLGKLEMLPQNVQNIIAEISQIKKEQAEFSDDPEFEVNFAIAYGCNEELSSAVKQIATDVTAGTILADDVNDDLIRSYMYLRDDIDLIVRTSGEMRYSGFFPMQSSYAEFYFTPLLWPEFSKSEFDKALESYASRHRRLGA